MFVFEISYLNLVLRCVKRWKILENNTAALLGVICLRDIVYSLISNSPPSPAPPRNKPTKGQGLGLTSQAGPSQDGELGRASAPVPGPAGLL